MATPPAIQKILDHQQAILGRLHYSESASTRLAHSSLSDLLTATDCSGNIARELAYWAHYSLDGFTYTGNMVTHGTLVTQSKSAARVGYGLLPGDLVFFDFDNVGHPTHVALYKGGGQIYNHGGPGNGPEVWSLQHNVDAADRIWVRRIIQPVAGTVTHPPVVSGTTTNPMHNKSIPALIARGTGDYFGLITGPNESHGGAYPSEQGYIKIIQEFLNWKLKSGLAVDGKFGSSTAAAVKVFQQHFMPGTTYFGQVWFDDWAKMASF